MSEVSGQAICSACYPFDVGDPFCPTCNVRIERRYEPPVEETLREFVCRMARENGAAEVLLTAEFAGICGLYTMVTGEIGVHFMGNSCEEFFWQGPTLGWHEPGGAFEWVGFQVFRRGFASPYHMQGILPDSEKTPFPMGGMRLDREELKDLFPYSKNILEAVCVMTDDIGAADVALAAEVGTVEGLYRMPDGDIGVYISLCGTELFWCGENLGWREADRCFREVSRAVNRRGLAPIGKHPRAMGWRTTKGGKWNGR